MPKFASQIDALRISIKGFLPESTGTAPSSPVEGQGWHDTGAAAWKVYLSTGWRTLVDARRQVIAGNGLTGGGDLSTDRTLAADFAADGAATANKVTRADDSRLSNSRPPNGSAGGDLAGSTYPNPTIAAGVVTLAKLAAAVKVAADGGSAAAGAAALRRLGTGADDALAGTTRLDTIASPTGSVSLNNQKITSLADPTAATDGANKQYVDQRVQGAEWKDSVRVASTASVTLPPGGTALSIDGVALANTNRVLLKDQSTASQNGIYVVSGIGSSVVLTRATDADTAGELTPNTAVFVEEGTTQADTGWTLTTDGTITIGTTAQAWTQFTGVGSLIAGQGLTKTGNTVDVGSVDGSIIVSADSITVGLVGVTKGGTGGNTVAEARVNLGWTIKYSGGNGSAITAGTWTSLPPPSNVANDWGNGKYNANEAMDLMFYEAATGERVFFDVRVNPASPYNLQFRSDIAYASAALFYSYSLTQYTL